MVSERTWVQSQVPTNFFVFIINTCRFNAPLVQTSYRALPISSQWIHHPFNPTSHMSRTMVYPQVNATWNQALTGLGWLMGLENSNRHPPFSITQAQFFSFFLFFLFLILLIISLIILINIKNHFFI